MKKRSLPSAVITLDMDGTLEDPYACCGVADYFGGTDNCRHVRWDTLADVGELHCEHPEAELVVLSWRHGLHDVTRRWHDLVGTDATLIFTPDSPDCRLLPGISRRGQVDFKSSVVRSLLEAGTDVLGSWDDNFEVVVALTKLGVDARHVKHKVDIPDPEYLLPRWPPDAVRPQQAWHRRKEQRIMESMEYR